MVFGGRAGLAAAEQKARPGKGIDAQLEDERRRMTVIMDRPAGPEKAGTIRSELGRLMRRHVGPLREASGLQEAATKVGELSTRYQKVGVTNKGRRYNYELVAFLELESLLTIGGVIPAAATVREDSRGAHHRPARPPRENAKGLTTTMAPPEPARPP